MNAKLDFQPPPSNDDAGHGNAPTDAPELAHSRRLWPFHAAAAISLIWLAGFCYLAWRQGFFTAAHDLPELAAALQGALLPIAIAWLVALVFQRTDPLLERRLGVARSLARALSPIDQAERRLDQVAIRIRNDMEHIEAAVDLAASRIDSLEDRFRAEISDLFSATADAEAKSTAIKDALRREREALAAVDEAVGERLGAMPAAVAAFAARLHEAVAEAGRVVDTASGQLEDRAAAISETARAAAGEIGAAESALNDRLGTLDALSEDVGTRLDIIAAALVRQIASLKAGMETVEALDARLKNNLGAHEARLAELARASEEEARRVSGMLQTAGEQLSGRAGEALERTEAAAAGFERSAGEIDRLVGGTLERAHEAFRNLGLELEERAGQARLLADREAEAALARIGDQVADLQSRLEGFECRFDETAGRIAETAAVRAREIDASAGEIETRAAKGIEELTRLSRSLVDQAEMVAAAAGEAARNMGVAGEKMDERTANLGQLLEDMRRRIEEVSERLESERGALAASSEASASTVLDAAEQFRVRAQSLSQHAEETTEQMRRSSEALDAEILRLDERGQTTASSLRAAISGLKSEGEGLLEALERSSDSLGQAATAFGGERERILADTTAAAERLTRAAETVSEKASTMRIAGDSTRQELDTVVHHFSTAAERILGAAESAKSGAAQSGEAFERTLAQAIAKGLREVGHSMDTLNTMFGAEVSELEERVTRTLDTTVAALRDAAAEAGSESERMAAQLAEQSDRLVHRATGFLNKSEEIERRILASSRDEFVRTSSLLIESLQSASVDIDKILETEVPDDVWQRYLAGDRSIFSRRTVRLADRKTRGRIRDIFEHDREFRDTVLKFFRDFEALMDQVQSRDKHSALSVTLISSEMGKLYVLLAQALKKLQ